MIELKDSIIEKLKCSECGCYLSCGPVLLKPDGESVCGRCDLDESTTSRAVRNKAYEDVASVLAFPCRYRQDGCPKLLAWNNIKNHEDNCDHRIYECPSIGACQWIGSNSKLLDHYKRNHSDLVLDYPCKLAPDLGKDGEENFLLTVFGFLFLVQIKLSSTLGKFWCCVRYLGNIAFVSNFEYTLEIRNYDSVMLKTKRVSPRNGLSITSKNSIEVSLKTLLDFLDGCERTTFTITVRKKGTVCFKCKKDLKPLKMYCVGDGYHCGNCHGDNMAEPEGYGQKFQLIRN